MFLSRLRDFSEWGQCQVLDFLLRYQPSTEDETFDMLVSRSAWNCQTVQSIKLDSSLLPPESEEVMEKVCRLTILFFD